MVDVLAAHQWEIDGLLLGDGTDYMVTDFEPGGKPQSETQDAALPGTDGVAFGRDYLGEGRVVTLEVTVDTHDPAAARDRWAALSRAWFADGVRTTPGAVSVLRLRVADSVPAMRVYGRPRKIDPANTPLIRAGRVDLVAEFTCADYRFYSDTRQVLTISGDPIAYQGIAGTIPPHVPPVTLADAVLPSDVATNTGTVDTFPVITFHGPRDKPGVSFGGDQSVWLATVLPAGVSITVDTRPWARSVRRSDGANFAGTLRGSRLSELTLPPGDTVVAFDGRDETLQSSVDITWRDATTTPL